MWSLLWPVLLGAVARFAFEVGRPLVIGYVAGAWASSLAVLAVTTGCADTKLNKTNPPPSPDAALPLVQFSMLSVSQDN